MEWFAMRHTSLQTDVCCSRSPARIWLAEIMVRSNCITYYKHANHRNHSDDDGETIVVPASAVGEVEDCLVYIATWAHDPKWYDNTENTQDMKNEDNNLCQRQTFSEEYIEQCTTNNNAYRQ